MIPTGLFSQIALLILSVGIIFTYIKPSFEEISKSQEQISAYQQERGKVAAVNASLEQKIQVIDGVFDLDKDKLLTYMPDVVDPLTVMRDLQMIADDSGVIVNDVVDAGPVDPGSVADPYSAYAPEGAGFDSYGVPIALEEGPFAYVFSLNVEGSYGQIKNLVSMLENNNYPLEVQSLDISSADGGFLTAEIGLYTYSLEKTKEKDTNLYEDVNVTYE